MQKIHGSGFGTSNAYVNDLAGKGFPVHQWTKRGYFQADLMSKKQIHPNISVVNLVSRTAGNQGECMMKA